MAFKRIKGMIREDDPRVAQVGHPGPPWMISYADLMTELVCFFVILYALSASLDKNTQSAGKEAEAAGKEAGMEVKTTVTKDGLFISVEEQQDKALFASGKAELSPEANVIIDKLVPILKKFKYDIEVQGHTDNIPVGGSAFSSNWELSTARATSVVRYLIDHHQFEPPRMGAMGYGEFRPIAPNDTPENRAKNRRVVFFLKTTVIADKNKEKKEQGGEGSPAAPDTPAPAQTPEPAVAAPKPGGEASPATTPFQTVGPKPPVDTKSVPLVETPKKSSTPPNTFTFPTGNSVATPPVAQPNTAPVTPPSNPPVQAPVKPTLKPVEATPKKPAPVTTPAPSGLREERGSPLTEPGKGRPTVNMSLAPAPATTPTSNRIINLPAVTLTLKKPTETPPKTSPPVIVTTPSQKPLELPPGISP